MKATIGVDRTEQLVEKKEINNRASVFPLGKPLVTGRPAFKPSNKQRTPQKPTERDGSIFDFLSFWGPTKDKQNNKPRRPLGALPAPPQSRPVKDPAQDLPVRPERVEQPGISSRIDGTISTEDNENDVEAYIVLPAQELKPKQKKPSRVPIGPQRPQQKFKGPRLPPPPPPSRPRVPPPPPARPLLGLPRAPPATRKQVPFIAKRPLLPPKVPATSSSTAVKKPLEKLFKKTESLSPKVIAKLTSQTKVHEGKKPFDFR